jgi:hypothetical protein
VAVNAWFELRYVIGSAIVVVAFGGPVAWTIWWAIGMIRAAYRRADEIDLRLRG